MTFDDARAAIYARLKTAMDASHAGVPVLYENRLLIDWDTQAAPFVAAELQLNDGEQAALGPTPPIRYRGGFYLQVWVKEGEGTKVALQILTTLANTFKTAKFSGITTMAPRPLPGTPFKGWYVHGLRVPFYFDDMTS